MYETGTSRKRRGGRSTWLATPSTTQPTRRRPLRISEIASGENLGRKIISADQPRVEQYRRIPASLSAWLGEFSVIVRYSTVAVTGRKHSTAPRSDPVSWDTGRDAGTQGRRDTETQGRRDAEGNCSQMTSDYCSQIGNCANAIVDASVAPSERATPGSAGILPAELGGAASRRATAWERGHLARGTGGCGVSSRHRLGARASSPRN